MFSRSDLDKLKERLASSGITGKLKSGLSVLWQKAAARLAANKEPDQQDGFEKSRWRTMLSKASFSPFQQFPTISVIVSASWILLIVISATPWRYTPFWWAVLWIGVIPVMIYWVIRRWWHKRQREKLQRRPNRLK